MSNQQKNNMGQFYTNLSKTANSASNTLKNIVSNTPKTFNSLIPLTNAKKQTPYNFVNNKSTAEIPVSTNTKLGKKMGWPVLVFVKGIKLLNVFGVFVTIFFKVFVVEFTVLLKLV